jgi:hypothetical protein
MPLAFSFTVLILSPNSSLTSLVGDHAGRLSWAVDGSVGDRRRVRDRAWRRFNAPLPALSRPVRARYPEGCGVRPCAMAIAMVSAIMTPTVIHDTTLYQREFVYWPISSRSLISRSTKINTNGSRIPFATCDRTITRSSGKRGTSSTPAPKTISSVYSQ